ncbi:hypothetical protein ACVST0_11680 [Yersinia enterocolitica]
MHPSYFKLYVRWLHSITRITYLCKLIGIILLAAFLQLELFWISHLHQIVLTAIAEKDNSCHAAMLGCCLCEIVIGWLFTL